MAVCTLFHNPRCSKSRAAKSLLEKHSIPFTLVEYIKTPPAPDVILNIASKLGGSVFDILRTNEALFQNNYANRDLSEQAVAELIHQNPGLLQRPLLVTEQHARVGRPPEVILEIIPKVD